HGATSRQPTNHGTWHKAERATAPKTPRTSQQQEKNMADAFLSTGRVITADEPGYQQACHEWNERFEIRPRAIVYCQNAQEVSAALRSALDRGLPFRLGCGGGSVGWFLVGNGGGGVGGGVMEAVAGGLGGRVGGSGGGGGAG